jgi:hypothetical protein
MASSSSGIVYINPEINPEYIPPIPVPQPCPENSNPYMNLDDVQLREAKYNNRRLSSHIENEIKIKTKSANGLMKEIRMIKNMINTKIMDPPSIDQDNEIYELRTKRQMIKGKMIDLILDICRLKEVRATLEVEIGQINLTRGLRKPDRLGELKKDLGKNFKETYKEVISIKPVVKIHNQEALSRMALQSSQGQFGACSMVTNIGSSS